MIDINYFIGVSVYMIEKSAIKLEEMAPSDWPSVRAIYEEGIRTGIATFQTEVPSWEEWDQGHLQRCRFIAKAGDQILGWVALSPVSSRCCYKGIGELSIYIHPDSKGLGIGTLLLQKLIDESEKQGFWTLQSAIIKENTASRALHKKCGFREIGFREKVAQMPDGTWHDTILIERRSRVVGK